jgi:hypothetical protein
MICKLYRLLFWMIPVKKWQSYIIESHFSTCRQCGETAAGDETIRPLVVSPRRAEKSGPLWPGVRRGILAQQRDNVRLKKRLPRWQLAAAAVVAVVVLMIPLKIRRGMEDNAQRDQIDMNRPVGAITLRSATLGGKPAHSHVFNSTNPDMTMIYITPHAGGADKKIKLGVKLGGQNEQTL